MRFFYNLLTILLYLPYALYWCVRAVLNESYRAKIEQRLGFGYPQLDGCIWIHAVSVGEVVAAAPLARAMRRRYPEVPLVLTTVTPTGAARVASLFGDDVIHTYIPFETPWSINRFFDSLKPKIALIMETEIWPNLYHGCGIRKIPLVLVSARISPKSVDSYRKLLPLFRETLSHGIVIAAQSQADADRFLSLGASAARTRVTGNIKYDIELPDNLHRDGSALRASLFPNRPVWIAASTHAKEEEMVLDAHRRLLVEHPDLLLILVPRHPDRFDEVAAQIQKQEFSCVRRTEQRACAEDVQVFLGDTMGEVMLFYAASDIAFVGGSLVPVGGHNLLEPAALGLPILSGPHVFNAQEIADVLANADACRIVADQTALAATVRELLNDADAAAALGRNGLAILENNRGAVKRLVEVIEPLLVQ